MIYVDTFIQHIPPFELKVKIETELKIGVAECGSGFNHLKRSIRKVGLIQVAPRFQLKYCASGDCTVLSTT
jgi:hypothetical protein